MLISVIVPNLNSPIIDQTLGSLVGQNFPRDQLEVIVVGLDKYGLIKDSNLIRHINTSNPISPAKARNLGVAQAQAEIIAFTDADCIAHTDWLKIIKEKFSNPEINVLGGGIEFETRNYWTLSDNLSMFYEYLSSQPAGEKSLLPSLNLAMRRDIFERVGGFDERYPRATGEDADLCIRLKKIGCRLYFEPKAIVTHVPARNKFLEIFRHGFYQGMYSTKVDPRYSNERNLPGIIYSQPGLLLFSPVLATGAIFKMIIVSREVRKYWYTLPALFLSKLAWCIGAASHPIW